MVEELNDLFPGQYSANHSYKIITSEPLKGGEAIKVIEPYDVLLRECPGTLLSQVDNVLVLTPEITDFPVRAGDQIQVVDPTFKTKDIGESPILSEKAHPRELLKTIAVSIAVENQLFNSQRDNVWCNLNIHSRPPISDDAPDPAQYNPFVVDIHGRSIHDTNWVRPPAIHGNWGVRSELAYESQAKIDRESIDDSGNLIPATSEEINLHKHDPMSRVGKEDFANWQNHPTGMYDWQGVRKYSMQDIEKLKQLFAQEFDITIEKYKDIELFTEENPPDQDFGQSDIAPLWQFGGYQLVTEKVPLVDPKDGIHMVLKILPKPHAPWDNPKATLEALAIGIGVSRLLKDTKDIMGNDIMGEIGDVYFDVNSNWGKPMMERKAGEQIETNDELKDIFYKDAGMHLHIQLEKMDARWEIPPAKGTFNNHQVQPPDVINEIRNILGDGKTGKLHKWLFDNCRGKIFPNP